MSQNGCDRVEQDTSIPVVQVDRIVHLAGVTIGTPEPVPETLRFHLQTQLGDEVVLDLHMALSAISFAVGKGVVPPLSSQWYNAVWRMHGVRPPW